VEVLAGPEARLDRNWEQVGEVALGELGTDIGAVACFLERVRVGVERHARAGVTEDPADLDDVEADVDDQVAGEGVAKIVETHPPTVAIESRSGGGSTEYPAVVRPAPAGRSHPVGHDRRYEPAIEISKSRKSR
jgi:hypothetical protein